jgi:hypothetical protein
VTMPINALHMSTGRDRARVFRYRL